jgi:iron-sulfur cluster assembly protein
MISVTESAKKYLLEQCENNNQTAIKLSVKGGGCAGFSYEYSFAAAAEPNDFVIDLDQTHQFILDSASILFVIGTELDYVTELGGSSLKLNNPNQTASCGCGKSFSV